VTGLAGLHPCLLGSPARCAFLSCPNTGIELWTTCTLQNPYFVWFSMFFIISGPFQPFTNIWKAWQSIFSNCQACHSSNFPCLSAFHPMPDSSHDPDVVTWCQELSHWNLELFWFILTCTKLNLLHFSCLKTSVLCVFVSVTWSQWVTNKSDDLFLVSLSCLQSRSGSAGAFTHTQLIV